MRLLDTESGRFETFSDPRNVQYAILSHVWSKREDTVYVFEQTFQDIVNIQTESEPDSNIFLKFSFKIQEACKIARRHGLKYIWIDTCCIDKQSSAELSEAINSMYHWYSCSTVCYAYLNDVVDKEDPRLYLRFFRCKWFTRGWTLQELIAPHNVVFLSGSWKTIGTKHELADLISNTTGIPSSILRHERLIADVSVAERMRWAAKRQVTVCEDEAYCLVGIFDVNLIPIYGEGRRAFTRLQQAILERIPDQSIFVWGHRKHVDTLGSPRPPHSPDPKLSISLSGSQMSYLLASSPQDFTTSLDVTTTSHYALAKHLGLDVTLTKYTTTPFGIHTRLPLLLCYDEAGTPYRLAFLACQVAGKRLVALILRSSQLSEPAGDMEMLVGSLKPIRDLSIHNTFTFQDISHGYHRLATIDIGLIRRSQARPQPADVYIRHAPSSSEHALSRDAPLHEMLCVSPPFNKLEVKMAPWSHALLEGRGYAVLSESSTSKGSQEFMIMCETEYISIRIERCTACQDGRNRGLLRAVVNPSYTHTPASHSSLGCHYDHIHSWDLRGGLASKTFVLPSKGSRSIRLTLSANPVGAREQSHRPYMLSVDIFTPSTLPGSVSRALGPLPPPDGPRDGDAKKRSMRSWSAPSGDPCDPSSVAPRGMPNRQRVISGTRARGPSVDAALLRPSGVQSTASPFVNTVEDLVYDEYVFDSSDEDDDDEDGIGDDSGDLCSLSDTVAGVGNLNNINTAGLGRDPGSKALPLTWGSAVTSQTFSAPGVQHANASSAGLRPAGPVFDGGAVSERNSTYPAKSLPKGETPLGYSGSGTMGPSRATLNVEKKAQGGSGPRKWRFWRRAS